MKTRATDILLEMMGDPEMSTRRRIQAAEALLGFEAPVDVINHAREYLASVLKIAKERKLRTAWRRRRSPASSRRSGSLLKRSTSPAAKRRIAARRGGNMSSINFRQR